MIGLTPLAATALAAFSAVTLTGISSAVMTPAAGNGNTAAMTSPAVVTPGTINYPANGATVTNGPVIVSGTILTASTTIKGTLKVDGVPVALDLTVPVEVNPWKWFWDPSSPGTYTLSVEVLSEPAVLETTPSVVVSITNASTLNLPIFPAPGTLEAQVTILSTGSTVYDLRDGDLYLEGTTTFLVNFYDPSYYVDNYSINSDTGVISRIGSDATLYATRDLDDEDFEGVTGIAGLVDGVRMWNQITLQEIANPSGSPRFGNQIIAGVASFAVNRIEPSTVRARSGTQSLRVYCEGASAEVSITKCLITASLLHFVVGEEFWCEFWVYVESGFPLGLVDLESTYGADSPGIRLLLNESRVPRFESKFFAKPSYPGSNPLPGGQWVKLRVYVLLSDTTSGAVKLWVNGVLEIDATGITAPTKSLVLDRVQLGITANSNAGPALAWFDDFLYQKTPIVGVEAVSMVAASGDTTPVTMSSAASTAVVGIMVAAVGDASSSTMATSSTATVAAAMDPAAGNGNTAAMVGNNFGVLSATIVPAAGDAVTLSLTGRRIGGNAWVQRTGSNSPWTRIR